MKGLKSVRVRNLRSFGNNNSFIPLKKLNILVGKNSCGKSTFLRAFPLLRQSVQADTRNPILWYGSFVDFGDNNTAINSSAKEVMFDFDLDVPVMEGADIIDRILGGFSDAGCNKENTFPVVFTLGIGRGVGADVHSRVKLVIEGVTVEIVYKESAVTKFALRYEDFVIEEFSGYTVASKGKLIPTDFSGSNSRKKNKNSYLGGDRVRSSFRESLADFILSLHHPNKKRETALTALNELAFKPKSQMGDSLIKLFPEDKVFNESIQKARDEISGVSFAYMVGAHLHKILESIDKVLSDFYSSVRYLGPVRASAERFYRYQDLQVAEVDHTGSNLPMVLNSLNARDRDKLNVWISDSFGFELKLANTGSHYALSIREQGSSEFHNVSDMGFGYSQLLPIIVSIWLENNAKNRFPFERGLSSKKQLVLAIEQPELHLHPQLQHMFGRAIAKIAKLQNESDFCFVLETHSKHIIDAIGECIEEDDLSNEDVSVTLFEKNGDGYTETSLSSYDENGYLIDWPAGFLSP